MILQLLLENLENRNQPKEKLSRFKRAINSFTELLIQLLVFILLWAAYLAIRWWLFWKRISRRWEYVKTKSNFRLEIGCSTQVNK